jgi:hypothetical protein
MKHFPRYGWEDGALAFAEQLVPDFQKGSQATALTEAQARDALAALERLESFRQQTGRRLSLLSIAEGYCSAIGKLGDHPLSEAIDTYLRLTQWSAHERHPLLIVAAGEWDVPDRRSLMQKIPETLFQVACLSASVSDFLK